MKHHAHDVLLVENDRDHAELIATSLRKRLACVEVTWLRDGDEALQHLRDAATTPQLILLDLRLAKWDGHDVLAALKRIPSLRAIPVIILTSSSCEDDISRACDLGASGYVVKPACFSDLGAELGDIIAHWLHTSARQGLVAAPCAASTTS
jgi:CheY-like chemotaxis protein